MRTLPIFLAIVATALLCRDALSQPQPAADWRPAMRAVHAKFTGRPGTFAQFGDSITDTAAFWTPLQYEHRNAQPELEQAIVAVKAYLRPECWLEWKGPENGSQGGQTTQWAIDHIDGWLKRLNPEAAVILFGTNDLRGTDSDRYAANLRTLVDHCIANGTVPILTTVPPRHGLELKAAAFAESVRRLARDASVPLIDFHDAILKRRPGDWDGALEKFAAYRDYDVPTLISRDGVHPSNPPKYQNDFSPEGLRSGGYTLRNALTVTRYAELITLFKQPAREEPVPRESRAGAIRLPEPPEQRWFPKAPALPPPAGEVIRVSNSAELYEAARRVRPGGAILLSDGAYAIDVPLEIKTDRVSLRGASGHRERVVLDAGDHGELLRITACSGVTVADLTVQNVQWNGIKINSETGVQNLTVYNCLLHNIWQRAIKGVKVPEQDRERLAPSGCAVRYCLFYNDHAKQPTDDPTDTDATFRGNYIGGIDVMFARGWVISDNVFTGIHGRTGEARGAVFLWHDVRGCTVERNIVLDCDSGICLGNSFRPDDIKVHCTECIVRNNFVTRCHENGILADYTTRCKIVNNTVYDPKSVLGRLIRIAHDSEGLKVVNNLVCGPPIRLETTSKVTLTANLQRDLTDQLVDAARGNLHLTSAATEAIGHAEPAPEVTDDIDRAPRGSSPDIGAHQLSR